MTFEEYAKQYLVDNGMFEEQTIDVIALLKQDKVVDKALRNRWNDHIEGYSSQFMGIFIYSVNRVTLEYIDANMPLAWFRGQFV